MISELIQQGDATMMQQSRAAYNKSCLLFFWGSHCSIYSLLSLSYYHSNKKCANQPYNNQCQNDIFSLKFEAKAENGKILRIFAHRRPSGIVVSDTQQTTANPRNRMAWHKGTWWPLYVKEWYAPKSSQHMFDPYSFCLLVLGLLFHLLIIIIIVYSNTVAIPIFYVSFYSYS